jgi:hypothetical protein
MTEDQKIGVDHTTCTQICLHGQCPYIPLVYKCFELEARKHFAAMSQFEFHANCQSLSVPQALGV